MNDVRIPDSELDFDNDLVFATSGVPFTGVGYEDVPGRGLSEISYRDGLQDGPARDWFAAGGLKGESHYRENVLHGVAREFDADGRMLSESVYEYGILVRATRWDSLGTLLEETAIAPESANFRLLERFRRDKGWPT